MTDSAKNIAEKINDPEAPAVFIRANSPLTATLGNSMAKVLENGLGVYDKLLEDSNTPYEELSRLADKIDTLSQHFTEAVAGNACMGHVKEATLNMFRNLSDCYLNQMAAETFAQQIAVQAHMLVVLSKFWGEDATKEARDKLAQVNKHYKHWHTAVIEANSAIIKLGDIEDRFLDKELNSEFGSFGTAGTGDNPIIPIFNDLRSECETMFNENRKAHLLHDLVQESLTYYKAAIRKLNGTATQNPHAALEKALSANPQPK